MHAKVFPAATLSISGLWVTGSEYACMHTMKLGTTYTATVLSNYTVDNANICSPLRGGAVLKL